MACSNLDAKKCTMEKFKETLRKKCPIKCGDPECVDTKECIDITVAECALLEEECPITCSKFDDDVSRDMF